MSKERLAVFLNIQSNRNPALLFCLKTLAEDYEITVISSDIFENAEDFPGVKFVNHSSLIEKISRITAFFSYNFFKVLKFFFLTSQKDWRKSADVLHTILDYILLQMCFLPFYTWRFVQKQPPTKGVICIDAGAMSSARLIKYLNKIPYFYWAYEIYPNQLPDGSKTLRRLMERVEKKGCANACFVAVTSDSWAKLLRRRYNLPDLKHHIVCVCPPNVEKFAELETGETVKFYYHGAYLKGRGLKNLIRAMRRIDGGILYLRGIGADYEAELKNEVERLNLSDKVEFLTPLPVKDLAEASTNFDVGVSMACITTSNAKFLIGFKTFENIAAGIALFAPPSFQLKEIIGKNNIGIIYKSCAEEDIAAALQFCVDNKSEIGRWKKNSRVLAQSKYNIEIQSGNLKAAVSRLLKDK